MGIGLKDLSWTMRFEPRFARLPSANLFWYKEGGLLLVAPENEAVRRHKNGALSLVLDLTDVEFTIDQDPKARAFFLDLACWLLQKCAEAAARAGELGE